jgi:hypothetical protein
MHLHVSGFTCPSSGNSAQMLFGVIACVGCVLIACGVRGAGCGVRGAGSGGTTT